MSAKSQSGGGTGIGADLLDSCFLGALLAVAVGLTEMVGNGAPAVVGSGAAVRELKSIGQLLSFHLAFGMVLGMIAVCVSRLLAPTGLLGAARALGLSLTAGSAAFLPVLAQTSPSVGAVRRLAMAGLASLVVAAAAMAVAILATRAFPRKTAARACGGLLIVSLVASFSWQRFDQTDPSASGDRANVILISLDTVRPDHLEAYGYPRPTSPNLSALARESVVFDAAFASEPWTLPSHMTMMTSLHPLSHGVLSRNTRLNGEIATLAEVLGEAGYTSTAFVAAGEESWIGAGRGFGDGFDNYHHPPHQHRNGRGTSLLWLYHTLWGAPAGSAPDINTAAIKYLDTARPAPAFLFLHYYDAHSDSTRLPYEAPESMIRMFLPEGQGDFDGCDEENRCASAFLGTRAGTTTSVETLSSVVGLYDAGLRYLDAELGQLFDGLRKHGYYANSLIIVTADHGEALLEHGSFLHTQVYDEVLRVPLLVKLPQGAYGGGRVRSLTGHVDMMPTVLEVLGIPYDGQMEGRSVAGSLTGVEMDAGYVFFSNTDQGDFVTREIGMRTLDRKLIISISHAGEEEPRETRLQLFDLVDDPGEQNNLAADELPAEAEWMRAAVWHWYRETQVFNRRFPAEISVELSEAEIERLKALGYLR